MSSNSKASNSTASITSLNVTSESGSASRKQTLTAQSPNLELDFEQTFKRNHPWQALYLPEVVDKSLEEVSYFELI